MMGASLISYMFMNIFSLLMLILMSLVGVSFLTLLERKVLSYIQLRKGPNKVSMGGLLQPFSDAVKLFTKEMFFIFNSFKFYYLACPLMILLVSLLSWVIFPMITNLSSFSLGMLFLFSCFSVNSYPLMMSGWSSNSIYPLFGALRSCAQVISYEVSFIIMMLSVIFLSETYNFFCYKSLMSNYVVLMMPVYVMFFVSMLAELNRMPFDFIEGESELVSGFNTEYFGVGFSLIFMGEYCSIMFMSMLSVVLFWGCSVDSFFFILIYLLVIYLIIMSRGALPRMRYDELMSLCWKVYLPMSLSYLFFIIGVKWLIIMLLICQ